MIGRRIIYQKLTWPNLPKQTQEAKIIENMLNEFVHKNIFTILKIKKNQIYISSSA